MTDSPIEMPMFPLGSVLFPGGVLPLHIFEPRYQQLLNHVLEADRRFGVVLINRGSEVGGGDVRAAVGTIAHIQDYKRFDDGRAAVVAVGHERLEVVEWLADDPYPKARVVEIPTEAEAVEDRAALDSARTSYSQLLEVGVRLGRLESAPDTDWETELEAATWQLAGRSPCTAHDQYSILAAPTRAARLARIEQLLHDVRADIELMGGLSES